jgi:hypothetical protein
VPPAYVHSLDDYWRWFYLHLDYSGGWLQHEPLQVEIIPDPVTMDPHELVAIRLPSQRLLFHDGSFLDFRLLVNDQLEQEEYSYHFASADDDLIWRKDKHPGHAHLTHIHRPPNEREPYEEVDIEEVIDQIRKHFGDQAQGLNSEAGAY